MKQKGSWTSGKLLLMPDCCTIHVKKRCIMSAKVIELAPHDNLIVKHETLDEAGLRGRLCLLVQKGEIRILPETGFDTEKVLDELAGCLGQENAADYDYSLKTGDLYEAR